MPFSGGAIHLFDLNCWSCAQDLANLKRHIRDCIVSFSTNNYLMHCLQMLQLLFLFSRSRIRDSSSCTSKAKWSTTARRSSTC
jgi:hypothetical protein